MVFKYFLILSLFIFGSYQNDRFLSTSSETLLFVVEIARHGARNPQTILPLNSTSVQYSTTLDLQQAGWLQHYYIGKELRTKYVDTGFLSSDYKSTEVYSQSTSASRTYNSIVGQLSGFFPYNAPANSWLPTSAGNSTQGYKITQANSSYNWATRLNEGNCNRYSYALSNVSASSNYATARTYFYNTYKSYLEKLTGWSSISETTFDDICEYIYFSSFNSSIQMNITPSDFDRNYCKAYENGWVYKTAFGLDVEWKLESYEFLNQLLEFSQYLQGKKSLSSLTTFQKYYALNNNGAAFPKFILYITHDEILAGFFDGLGWHKSQGASPAATMFFEFYNDTSKQTYVRAFYKDTNTSTSEEVKVNGASSGTMKIADFEAAIQARITAGGLTNLKTSCSDTSAMSGTFYDPQKFQNEMIEIYQLSNGRLLSLGISMIFLIVGSLFTY